MNLAVFGQKQGTGVQSEIELLLATQKCHQTLINACSPHLTGLGHVANIPLPCGSVRKRRASPLYRSRTWSGSVDRSLDPWTRAIRRMEEYR